MSLNERVNLGHTGSTIRAEVLEGKTPQETERNIAFCQSCPSRHIRECWLKFDENKVNVLNYKCEFFRKIHDAFRILDRQAQDSFFEYR